MGGEDLKLKVGEESIRAQIGNKVVDMDNSFVIERAAQASLCFFCPSLMVDNHIVGKGRVG